jgi:hypothetical protein
MMIVLGSCLPVELKTTCIHRIPVFALMIALHNDIPLAYIIVYMYPLPACGVRVYVGYIKPNPTGGLPVYGGADSQNTERPPLLTSWMGYNHSQINAFAHQIEKKLFHLLV